MTVESGRRGFLSPVNCSVRGAALLSLSAVKLLQSLKSSDLLPAGFLSERQWGAIDKACGEDFALPGNPTYTAACQALLTQASATAGKFYVYDVYDTCGADQMKSKATGTLDELVRAP